MKDFGVVRVRVLNAIEVSLILGGVESLEFVLGFLECVSSSCAKNRAVGSDDYVVEL